MGIWTPGLVCVVRYPGQPLVSARFGRRTHSGRLDHATPVGSVCLCCGRRPVGSRRPGCATLYPCGCDDSGLVDCSVQRRWLWVFCGRLAPYRGDKNRLAGLFDATGHPALGRTDVQRLARLDGAGGYGHRRCGRDPGSTWSGGWFSRNAHHACE